MLGYEFKSSGLLRRCHAYIDSVLIHRTVSLTPLLLCTPKHYTHSCFLTQGSRCHPLAFYPNHSITIFSNVKKWLYAYVWVFCLHAYLCTRCMPNALRAQKRILDPLRLELSMVVSCRVVPPIKPRSSGGAARAPGHGVIFPASWPWSSHCSYNRDHSHPVAILLFGCKHCSPECFGLLCFMSFSFVAPKIFILLSFLAFR